MMSLLLGFLGSPEDPDCYKEILGALLGTRDSLIRCGLAHDLP